MTPGSRRAAALGLGLALLVAAEGIARLVSGPPPRTWQTATGWAGCWFQDIALPDGTPAVGPCVAQGTPSPTQLWPSAEARPRAIVLGGSSVFVGRDKPWPHFPEVLDGMLDGASVVNGGAPGVNSAGVLQRVIDLEARDIDVIVIYTGHNDVAGRVFGTSAAVAPARITATLERSWIFHGVRQAVRRTRSGPSEAARGLVKGRSANGAPASLAPVYGPGELDAVAAALQANLEAAVAAAAPRPVVLVTPLSNPLWPPIATVPGSTALPLSGDCATDRSLALENALAAWQAVQAADACDDDAWLLDAAAAVRQLDTAPLRASDGIVDAVRAAAAASGATLVDLDVALPTDLRASSRPFADIVHFDRSGHRDVARALAPAVSEALGVPAP